MASRWNEDMCIRLYGISTLEHDMLLLQKQWTYVYPLVYYFHIPPQSKVLFNSKADKAKFVSVHLDPEYVDSLTPTIKKCNEFTASNWTI